MEAVEFVATIVLVTASGALAPGPLFFATISKGAEEGVKTGIVFSVAHTIVEFSLVLLLALGLLTVSSEPFVQFGIGVAGGLVLIVFGVLQILKMYRLKSVSADRSGSVKIHKLFLLGVSLTGLNPYFIMWWITVGAELILIALAFAGLFGVVFMYVCHVWMDYVWLIFISYLSKRGGDLLKVRWYRFMIGFFGVVLIYFGFVFILNVV